MFRSPPIDALVILIIVLLILGPKRLPGIGKGLGSGMREFKEGITGESKDGVNAAKDLAQAASQFQTLSTSSNLSAGDRATIAAAAGRLAAASKALPQSTPKNVPITIGVGEPFTTTLTVCFWAALLLTLPVLLYEAYAFVIPALSANERKVAAPVLFAAPA